MTDVLMFVIAVAAIVYAALYERRLGRAERGDREFAKRHRVDAPRFDRPAADRNDPSPRPRGDYEWRAIAEGDARR